MNTAINIQEKIQHLLNGHPLVQKIINTLTTHGYTVLLVGGAVRDMLLGMQSKDLDFEVYNASCQDLESVLRQFGPVIVVGKSYGVLRVHGLDVDWSLPRTDGVGRKPQVSVDPHMAYKDAFRRRDLTVNAMGIDMQTGGIIDPYNGQEDLANKVLRAPDLHTFVEDPLRFYRVMQFVGRFGMSVDATLNEICATMSLEGVSRERIELEFEKLLLKSKRPSLGIRWLRTINRLYEVVPVLFECIGVPQRPDYHPEGDVFEHSMQVVDAAALVVKLYENNEKKLIMLYAALFHDIGKKDTTKWEDGRWRSIGHAEHGAALARPALLRITHKKSIIRAVVKLIHYHMELGSYVSSGAKSGAYKMLAYKLAPENTIRTLIDLFLVDRQGRNPKSQEPLIIIDPEITKATEQAQEAGVLDTPEAPILHGEDLFDVVTSEKEIGALLERAYEIQIRKGITDKKELKKRILS